MSPRILGGVAVVLLGLILTSQFRRREQAAAPPPTAATQGTATAAAPGAAPGRAPMTSVHPEALAGPTTGTPTIDLMAILAVRRRLEREGSAVYLDSLLAQTDSTLVRWADRGGEPLRVAFTVDSTLTGWTPALLDAARGGMASWANNSAGLRFAEVRDSVGADITVSFVSVVSDSGEFGVTQTQWNINGNTERVEIRLALRPAEGAPLITPTLMRRVATHEFGHAIGLPHSASRDDIMFPSSPVAAPSRRDQATLQLLYAVPPGSIRTP